MEKKLEGQNELIGVVQEKLDGPKLLLKSNSGTPSHAAIAASGVASMGDTRDGYQGCHPWKIDKINIM